MDRADYPMPLTLLCIATYRKGDEFLRECRRQGCRVLLLTDEKLRDARLAARVDRRVLLRASRHARGRHPQGGGLPRAHRTDRSHRRRSTTSTSRPPRCCASTSYVPGMGETTARGFRDKLAMRARARAAGIPCPDFVHTVNNDAVQDWIDADRAAVGAQAALAGGGDRHPQDRQRRRSVAHARRARRRPRRVPARAIRPGRRLPRRLAGLRPPRRLRRGQPLRARRRWRSRTKVASS